MKRILAMILCLCMVFALAACGEKGEGTAGENPGDNTKASTTGTDTSSASDSGSGDSGTADAVPNLVMVCNSITDVFGVYDMSLLEDGDYLEDGLVWSCTVGEGADMKYREDTVFGDVIVTCGAGVAKILTYPDAEILWQTGNPGNNPHAIEILPSGNVVIANSTGNTLRIFYTSALLTGDEETANKYKDYELTDAHGVLWDPEYETLWALGGNELAGYTVTGDGTSQKLTKINGMGAQLPSGKNGGHDLSADFTSKQHLYLTVNSTVFRFDKDTGTLNEKFPQYAKLTGSAIKGFSNNQNGNFFYSKVNNGPGTSWENEEFAAWCTDRIHYCYMKSENFMYVQEYVSQEGAFYKIRAFVGQYQ